jgi:hypothetical protein
MAQLNESHGRIKPPPRTEDIKVLREYVANLAEMHAKLAKDLDYIINGNLDVKNLRAKSVTADALSVDELSAITAHLGHVISGLIETITMVGSLIMTDYPGNYPRAEMSNTNKLFRVEKSADRFAEFMADFALGPEGGAPVARFRHDGLDLYLGKLISGIFGNNIFNLYTSGALSLYAIQGLLLNGGVEVEDWSSLANMDNGKTLQQELSEIKNSIISLTTLVNNKASKGSNTSSVSDHNHGIQDGTVLMKYDGSPVTYHASGGHSHVQN